MFFLKKQRYKPIYKKFIKLRSNILNNKKIFNFKKKKWNIFLFHLIKNSKRYRNKPFPIGNFYIPTFSSSGNSFKKQFRYNLQNKKKFSIFYGGLRQNKIKNLVKLIFKFKQNKDFNFNFLESLENRLDSVLFRAYFSSSFRNSAQMISHGMIMINKKIVKDKSYILKSGDLISINPKYFALIQKNFNKLLFESRLDYVLFKLNFISNLNKSQQLINNGVILVNKKIVKDKSYLVKPGDLISINPKYYTIIHKKFKRIKKLFFWSKYEWFWAIPPSYLTIKYKTMQIIFEKNKNLNFSSYFSFFLDTNKILKIYK